MRMRKTQITQWSEKVPHQITKKAIQDEQQIQTTITANINYIQKFVYIKKKLLSRSKYIQIKQTKQINVYFTRKLEKILDHSIIKLGNN